MSMNPKGPRAGASCTNKPTEPAAVAIEAAAATEPPPVPCIGPVIREQDRLMPVANVSRIMRRGLPAHAKISDDAKEVVQDCVSEFISFVTGEANERCHTEHRKTVTAEDLVWALDRLGFDDYVGPLDAFLQRMREIESGGDGGRGPRRGSSLVAPHSAQTIRPAAVYGHPAYAVVGPVPPRPVLGSNAAAARFGGRYQMPRGGGQQRSMVPYYGGAALQAGGSRHGPEFYADEASSSNELAPPAPRAGSRR